MFWSHQQTWGRFIWRGMWLFTNSSSLKCMTVNIIMLTIITTCKDGDWWFWNPLIKFLTGWMFPPFRPPNPLLSYPDILTRATERFNQMFSPVSQSENICVRDYSTPFEGGLFLHKKVGVGVEQSEGDLFLLKHWTIRGWGVPPLSTYLTWSHSFFQGV